MRTPVLLLAAVAGALSACSGGPSDGDYAELVELAEPRLTNVTVDDVTDVDGDWVLITGAAELRDDLFTEFSDSDGGDACGFGFYQFGIAADLTHGPDTRLFQATTTAGTEAVVAVELVAERGEAGEVDADGDVLAADELTSGGWKWAASGGGWEVDGVPSYQLGFPASFYSDFDRGVVVDDAHLEQLCAAAGEVDPG